MSLIKKHGKETCTASLVIHEMYYGMHKLDTGRVKHNLQRYLRMLKEQALVVLSYDQDSAEWHAQERARLAAAGKTPAFVDGQIAAIACTQRLILVTRNTSDFGGFKGLEMENWFTGAA
jgi:tRNA(fMet)-specific endonuclease VapC